jgi:hypothetical protein
MAADIRKGIMVKTIIPYYYLVGGTGFEPVTSTVCKDQNNQLK